MKIYEKPMANFENIVVEDVITTSIVEDLSAVMADKYADADAVIVFEW